MSSTETEKDPPIMESVRTDEPPVDETVDESAETGWHFWNVIKGRTADGARRSWAWIIQAKNNVKSWAWSGMKATGRGAKHTGRGIWWGVTWVLNLVGVVLYATARFVGIALVYALSFLLLLVVWVLTAIVYGVQYAIYMLIKVVHFVTLVVCSPYIAMKSRQALKEDWQIFRTGLHWRNLHIVHPSALAAETLRERERKAGNQEQMRNATGSPDGQVPRPAAANTTEPKGRETPRQATRRPPRVPRVNPT